MVDERRLDFGHRMVHRHGTYRAATLSLNSSALWPLARQLATRFVQVSMVLDMNPRSSRAQRLT